MKDEEVLQDCFWPGPPTRQHDMNLLGLGVFGFHNGSDLQDYESNLDTDWSPLEIVFLIPYKLVLVLLLLAEYDVLRVGWRDSKFLQV